MQYKLWYYTAKARLLTAYNGLACIPYGHDLKHAIAETLTHLDTLEEEAKQ